MVRYAAILRGTESAWQAISYGIESVPIIASVGGVYLNFGLWGISILPAWLLVRHLGASKTEEQEGDSETSVCGEQIGVVAVKQML